MRRWLVSSSSEPAVTENTEWGVVEQLSLFDDSLFEPEPEAEVADDESLAAEPTPAPAAPEGPLVRVRAVVAYDGTDFRGIAVQKGHHRTVGGALTSAISRVVRYPVTLTLSGRTDAGVHAWGQVVSFDIPASTPPELIDGLAVRLTKMLGPEIVVRSLEVAEEGFDARRWATGRRYRYTILNTPAPDPFTARYAWWLPEPLDLNAMRMGADALLGEHEFTSFCRRPQPLSDGTPASLVRIVRDVRWVVDEECAGGGHRLRFEIKASSFCQQMVRAVVGTLVEMGTGRKKAGEMLAILLAKDRHAAGQLAPPHGLSLWEVTYDDPEGRPVL